MLVETRVRDLLATAAALHRRPASTSTSTSRPANRCRSIASFLTAAEKQKLLVQMGYMYRYSPAVVLLRKFLQKAGSATCSRSTP